MKARTKKIDTITNPFSDKMTDFFYFLTQHKTKLFLKNKLNFLRNISLLFLYLGALFINSSHADVLTPLNLKNIKGVSSSQPLKVLAVQDQANHDDNWDNYTEFLIDGHGYKGVFTFNAPADMKNLDKMVLHANYRGEEKQWQRWIFKIFDYQAKKWVYVADNTGAQSWKWKSIVKSVGTNPKRFINHNNIIKVRFYTKGLEDNSQLDYLVIKTASKEAPDNKPTSVTKLASVAKLAPAAKPATVAKPAPAAKPVPNSKVKRITLEEVKHWVYNIQHVSTSANIEALVGSHFDMYVLEPTRSEKGENFNMKKLVKDIRDYNIQKYNKDPIILAYVDIGQAEEWRWYFGNGWKIGNPYWLVANDPNGWDGNYPVAYWNPTWHNIMYKGYKGTSSVKQTLEDDFDGIYMDWVEAFSDENVIAAAKKDGVNPANEMFKLIEGIKNYARKSKSDYLIVAQNAPDLYQENPTRYINSIDAIAEEAVWFEGSGGFDTWGNKKGYNIPTNSMYPGWTEESLKHLNKIKQHMPVFVAEYAQDLDGKNYASKVYNELAPKYGFIPYCTQRSLQRLSTKPYPKGYSPIDY